MLVAACRLSTSKRPWRWWKTRSPHAAPSEWNRSVRSPNISSKCQSIEGAWSPIRCGRCYPSWLARYLNVQAHRSEEHTSEVQSPCNLVCRVLLEKKAAPDDLASDAYLALWRGRTGARVLRA